MKLQIKVNDETYRALRDWWSRQAPLSIRNIEFVYPLPERGEDAYAEAELVEESPR